MQHNFLHAEVLAVLDWQILLPVYRLFMLAVGEEAHQIAQHQ
jgi:hypothetical protein